MKRERQKSSKVPLDLAEPVVSLRERLWRMFPQSPILRGIGIGISICVFIGVVVIVFFKGRQAKGIAELQEGVRLLRDDDIALAALQIEAAKRHLAGGEEAYLIQLALLKLGNIEEKKGDFLEARQHYEASANIEGPLKAESLLAVARVLSLTKDDSSTVYYRRLLTQYPDFFMSEVVRQKLGEE
jgi:tetratricopeptide (TPR) repeat protein